MKTQQRGFTIIELIVVIALLGILSAVALPRFINVTSNAHDASVEGAGAGFATGVALFKAQVVANGNLGGFTADIQGYGEDTLDANSLGYPVGTGIASSAAAPSAAECVNLWTGILDANGPVASTGSGSGIDYAVTHTSSSTVDLVCTFTYKQQKDGADRLISYTASTGAVSITIP